VTTVSPHIAVPSADAAQAVRRQAFTRATSMFPTRTNPDKVCLSPALRLASCPRPGRTS
jgi:lactate dehydrogenase-like 2-hydroxyacid dehydrogenase